MKFLKIRRMCGGGMWAHSIALAWDCRDWRELNFALEPRRIDGAIILDGPGVAVAWRGDWG